MEVTERQSYRDIKLKCGEFLLGLLADNKLPHSSVQLLLPQVEAFVNDAVTSFAYKVKTKLSSYKGIQEAVDSISHPVKLFEGLTTSKGQIPYFVREFGLVEPEVITLPTNQLVDFGRHRAGNDQYFKNQKYIYIPLHKQLHQLLNIKDVYNEILLKKCESPTSGKYLKAA